MLDDKDAVILPFRQENKSAGLKCEASEFLNCFLSVVIDLGQFLHHSLIVSLVMNCKELLC